jgi:hypothetical protein
VRRLDIELLLDIKESLNRVNHVEDGHICAGFRKTLGKGKTTASRTTSDKCRTAFKGELVLTLVFQCDRFG